MISKILRMTIVLLLVLGSIYIGVLVYQWVYHFLDFQIVFYKWFLQAGEQAHGVKEYAWDLVNSARDFLWIEWWKELVQQNDTVMDIEEKIQGFQSQLQFISTVIWWWVGIMVYKIWFDLVFWIKKTIHDIKSFIFDN